MKQTPPASLRHVFCPPWIMLVPLANGLHHGTRDSSCKNSAGHFRETRLFMAGDFEVVGNIESPAVSFDEQKVGISLSAVN